MKYKKLLVWLAIVVIWFLLTMDQLQPDYSSPIVIPNPWSVIQRFIELVQNGYGGTINNRISFWEHMNASFGRLLMAIFYAIITAIPLGLVCGYVKKLETVVSAIVDFVRPLPPLAYYTIIIFLVKSLGDEPKIILLYIAAFCPLYIACVMAVRQVKQDHILSAQTLGANNLQIFTHVVFPSSLPNIFTGLRTAVSVAYTTLVSAEIFAAEKGLGFLIFRGYDNTQTDLVFVGILVIGISAILLDTLLKYTEEKVVFWKGQI